MVFKNLLHNSAQLPWTWDIQLMLSVLVWHRLLFSSFSQSSIHAMSLGFVYVLIVCQRFSGHISMLKKQIWRFCNTSWWFFPTGLQGPALLCFMWLQSTDKLALMQWNSLCCAFLTAEIPKHSSLPVSKYFPPKFLFLWLRSPGWGFRIAWGTKRRAAGAIMVEGGVTETEYWNKGSTWGCNFLAVIEDGTKVCNLWRVSRSWPFYLSAGYRAFMFLTPQICSEESEDKCLYAISLHCLWGANKNQALLPPWAWYFFPT